MGELVDGGVVIEWMGGWGVRGEWVDGWVSDLVGDWVGWWVIGWVGG